MAKNKPPFKLSVSERAKQFAPFAAVKGLEEALAAKEKICVPRRELLDELSEEINDALCKAEQGKILTVVYYKDGEYIRVTGMVAKIDIYSRIIQIVTTPIPFDDIYEIINK